jgi:putative ABC transport system permease protein
MGLSLALAASFIILLFVINELSYNTYFKNRKQIYRVLKYNEDVKVTDESTPYVLSKHLKDGFPQIKYVAPTRIVREFSLKLNEEFIPVKNAIGSNSEIFKIFNLTLIGQQEDILEEPNSIVLSQDQAQKFFPDENPIGKELIAQANNREVVFEVKGVFKNIPDNATFQADCFINSKWALDQINNRKEDKNAETS